MKLFISLYHHEKNTQLEHTIMWKHEACFHISRGLGSWADLTVVFCLSQKAMET